MHTYLVAFLFCHLTILHYIILHCIVQVGDVLLAVDGMEVTGKDFDLALLALKVRTVCAIRTLRRACTVRTVHIVRAANMC